MTEKVANALNSFFAVFAPPPKLTLSEWSDAKAYLSDESSAEAGKWTTISYQRGIQDAMTDPTIEEVWVKKSSRVGFTKMLNNLIAYHIDHDPCAIFQVQPTIEDAEGYSKEEIATMIRDTPCLQGKVSEARVKDSDNTIAMKKFPGGLLQLVGANSGRAFRRVSRRLILPDEIDAYPPSAGTEGDPVKLAMKRSEYFWNRKIVGGSTPLIKEESRIERLYENTDKRKFYVPCPHCNHFDYLVFQEKKDKEGVHGHHMKFETDKPQDAYFVCSKSGCVIEHKDKREMIEKGEWRATASEKKTGSGRLRVGFHIWAAYSFSPNASWGAIATEFMEAKSNKEELKTFVNTTLGETWEEEYSNKVNADELEKRKEFYEPNTVAKVAVIVTAGIDVQDNRFEITKYGWAPGEENWVISKDEIFGDPSKPAIWKQLDELILFKMKHESGKEISVHVAVLDSGGHHTHEVYNYVRERKKLAPRVHFICTKGQSQRNKPAIGKPTTVDINLRGQTLKGGAQVYPMGSDTVKNVIFSRLAKNIEPGPGYTHFHTDLGPEFFDQLLSEKKITRIVKGQPMTDWVLKKSGQRNEVLDCAVLAYVGLQFLYTKYHRATIWAQFAKKLGVTTTVVTEKPEKQDEGQLDIPENNVEESVDKALETEIKPKQETSGQTKGALSKLRPNRQFRGNWVGKFSK